MVNHLSHTVREHLHFFVIVPLLIIIMTWPTFLHVFSTDLIWLPSTNNDVWMKFWDAWHLDRILSGEAGYLFTDRLFHPNGLSLVYHNFNIPHMMALSGLQQVMPGSNAYNLSFLLIVGVNALAAYMYLLYYFHDRWLGLIGSVVFALGPLVQSHPQHPDINFIAIVPMSLYFLDRGIVEKRWLWIGLASCFIASSLLFGLYIFVCLMLTVGLLLLCYVRTHWSNPAFWWRMIVLFIIVGTFSLIRVYPLIEDASSLEHALDKRQGREQNNDLLAYFVNLRHPSNAAVFSSIFDIPPSDLEGGSYLGYLPLLLIAVGFIRGTNRRKLTPWLVLIVAFLLLRLGSTLTVGERTFYDFRLPKYYLDLAFPALFKSFWDTAHYQIGVVLPLAVLTCFGLKTLLNAVTPKYRYVFVLVFLCAISYEYYQAPDPRILPDDAFDFLDWLGREEEQDQIRLINLPMGREESKLYGYFQTLSGYPHVEGLAGRTPPPAYAYISDNLLLESWNRGNAIICIAVGRESYLAALDQLIADGFSHLVAHRTLPEYELIMRSFAGIPVSYEDEYVSIYRIADLRTSCDSSALLVPNALTHLSDLDLPLSDFPSRKVAALTLHPSGDISAGMLPLYTSFFSEWSSLLHLNLADGKVMHPPPPIGQLKSAEDMLSANSTFVLVYDPNQTVETELESYRSWLSRDFKRCERILDSEDIVIDFFIRHDLPCDLEIDDNPFAIEYDNGIRLGTLVTLLRERRLDLHFLWSDLPDGSYAFSIQLFDAGGAKALGHDFVIADKPLAHQHIDLSALLPGDYVAKLIVYNYDTGTSVPGTVISSGTRFDRALEIGRITLD